MFEYVLIIVGTSVLTMALNFFTLRHLFGKITEGFTSMTKMGAQAMGIKSGISRGTKAAMNDAAGQFLHSPHFAGIKMLASQFGFDIDDMVEEHGEVETLAGITQFLGMLGIDINKVMNGGLKNIAKSFLGTEHTVSSERLP